MIEINFKGNSMENIIRQIQSFVEKIEAKEMQKNGGRPPRKTADRNKGDMGEGQHQ